MAEDVKCGGTMGVLRVGTVRRARPPRLADIPRSQTFYKNSKLGGIDSTQVNRSKDISSYRHSAVDVTNGSSPASWQNTADAHRLSTHQASGRANLAKCHLARSAEGGSPRGRAPRESRRVSLAQAAGYVQLNQYRLLEPIGQGSYGIVKLAYNEEDDTHYAMKILSKRKLMRRAGLFGRPPPRAGPPPDPLQRVYREIAVLKKLDHPNVVKLVEVLDDPAEDQLYLVFQLLEGGPVIDIPTEHPLSEDQARRYFRDALLGVEYLHYQGIAHRDLKPANLLRGEGRVQVADLGASGELAARLSGAVGTPAFRAPEAFAAADNYDGEAADIWSLGVTLYAMVTGRVPWAGATAAELHRRVLTEPLSFPPRLQCQQLRHLLTRMLEKDPNKRITLKEIKEHPWVTANGSEPLPSEQENCRLVEVTEEDMARVVTSIPNLSTLILIKTMLKKHSFQNPFLRSREGSTSRRESLAPRGEPGADDRSRRATLARAGRSLSAPGNYLTERQASFDINLESVQEIRDQSQDITSPKDDTGSTIATNSPVIATAADTANNSTSTLETSISKDTSPSRTLVSTINTSSSVSTCSASCSSAGDFTVTTSTISPLVSTKSLKITETEKSNAPTGLPNAVPILNKPTTLSNTSTASSSNTSTPSSTTPTCLKVDVVSSMTNKSTSSQPVLKGVSSGR